ncbi:MAG: hypothetical protein JSW38_01895 [Dehalococcoidia bacterium]|nr:MAG: hypothetical protein JSW38_01895 [Dehalococcoidia bacterium]
MKGTLKLSVVSMVLTLALAIGLTTMASAQDNTINLVVSPNVLNLGSSGGVVTLHADIGYSSQYELELEVNNQSLPIAFTFPDSRGDLVIKCNLTIVKDMVEVGEATFNLTINELYTGTDTIRVIDPCTLK